MVWVMSTKFKMLILSIYDEQSNYNFSPEFTQTLADIKPNVEAMVLADKTMKHNRMVVIGELVKHRRTTVNADDKKAIRQMLSTWSSDVVDNASVAYKTYTELKGKGVEEFERLADAATPTQLLLIGRGKGTSLAYDAAMKLRREGKVPKEAQLRGHLAGHNNSKFESKHRHTKQSHNHQQQQSKSEPKQLTDLDLDFIRAGVTDDERRSHLTSLIHNENLELINTPQLAASWNQLSVDEMIQLIDQKLRLSNNADTHVEVRLREVLEAHTKRVNEGKCKKFQASLEGLSPHERWMRLNHPAMHC